MSRFHGVSAISRSLPIRNQELHRLPPPRPGERLREAQLPSPLVGKGHVPRCSPWVAVDSKIILYGIYPSWASGRGYWCVSNRTKENLNKEWKSCWVAGFAPAGALCGYPTSTTFHPKIVRSFVPPPSQPPLSSWISRSQLRICPRRYMTSLKPCAQKRLNARCIV